MYRGCEKYVSVNTHIHRHTRQFLRIDTLTGEAALIWNGHIYEDENYLKLQ